MEIRTFGEGVRMLECQRQLAELSRVGEFAFSRLSILPIPSTRDRKSINGTDISLWELVNEACGGDAVAGYAIPDNIKSELELRGACVYDAALDERFLLRNAELTAQGALGYILTRFSKAISDLQIGIVGYGRIGSCLLRYLLFLGAPVRLYTTRESVAMELSMAGVRATSAFDGLSELDVLVNTAPARLLRNAEIRSLTLCGQVIDLASGNVYSDMADVIRIPSIPEKYYPVSAGKLYAEHIARWLEEDKV